MASLLSLLSSSRMIVRVATCGDVGGVAGDATARSSWVNWYGRPPLVSAHLAEAGQLEVLGRRSASWSNVTTIPSTDSNVAGALRRDAGGQRRSSTAAGSGRCRCDTSSTEPLPVTDTWVISKNSSTVSAQAHEVAGGERRARATAEHEQPLGRRRVVVGVGVLLLDEEAVERRPGG